MICIVDYFEDKQIINFIYIVFLLNNFISYVVFICMFIYFIKKVFISNF